MLEFISILHRLQRRVNKAFLPKLKEHGITVPEMMVLIQVLHNGYFRPTDMAKKAGIPASTFTGILDRMVNHGFLLRETDPDDRRGVIIRGTPLLYETANHVRGECEAQFDEVFRNVPAELMEQTVGNMRQIYDLTADDDDGESSDELIKFWK